MSIRAISNVALVVLFVSGSSAPAPAFVKHFRYFAPDQQGETSTQKLAFVLDKSVGNPGDPKRFYIEDLELSMAVDPKTDQIDTNLLEQEDSVELSFVANDTYWSIEPKSCVAKDGLRNKQWLFCAVNDDKSGFVIETKPGTGAVTLHFGKLWQDSTSAVPVPINYADLPDFLVIKQNENATNRLVVADDQPDFVSVELVDAQSPK
jgi:hypothetical protein